MPWKQMYHWVHWADGGVGLSELQFSPSVVEMGFRKALPVGQRATGHRMGADVLDDI